MERNNLYESAHWKTSGGVMRPGGLELTQHLLNLSCLRQGAYILDLGCGRGATTAFLAGAGFEVVGMDPSAVLLEQAWKCCPNLTFVKGDAASIPFADETFDAVLLECVLSVISTKEALAECARVIRARGCLIISDVYDPDGVGGPLSRAWWESQLAAIGFRYAYFEDRTRDLKNFTAQLLWDMGSLDGLCGCMGCEIPSRPGYFALIAEKGEP